jgi:protein-tyrosine phosphatase
MDRGRLIDLHCHILPGIDDGAADLEDSVAMAAQAAADGIGVICATPHIRHDHDVIIEELGARVGELNRELRRRRLPVTVVKGGEVAETILEHLDPGELKTVALGHGGRWILLEPAPGPLSDSLEAATADLHRRGFGVLVAHPERHLAHDLEPRLAALIAAGALVQATAAHLAAPESAAGMATLARRGLIHVLGSDAHSARFGRPVELSSALARLGEAEILAPHRDWIAAAAPRMILDGDEIEPPFTARPER